MKKLVYVIIAAVLIYFGWQYFFSLIQFDKEISDGGNGIGNAVIHTRDLGYLIVGTMETEQASGGVTSIVKKLDKNGKELWERIFDYGEIQKSKLLSAVQTNEGGFIFVGSNTENSAGGDDGWIVITNNSGEEKFNEVYGESGDDFFSSIIRLTDGTYCTAGGTSKYKGSNSDGWLVKYNRLFSPQWEAKLETGGNNRIKEIAESYDGSIIGTGSSTSGGKGGTDFWVFKIDAEGNTVWQKYFGGDGDDGGESILAVEDGMIAAGYKNNQFYIIKIDFEGSIIWEKAIGEESNTIAQNIIRLKNQKIIISGAKNYKENISGKLWIVEINDKGEVMKEKTISSGKMNYLHDLTPSYDRGFAGCGSKTSMVGTVSNIWFAKFKPWK